MDVVIAIVGLVLGCLGLWFGIIAGIGLLALSDMLVLSLLLTGIVFALVGLILSIIGKKKSENKSVATAGIKSLVFDFSGVNTLSVTKVEVSQ